MIKVVKNIDEKLYSDIKALENACYEALKLELDYKMNFKQSKNQEYLYYVDEKLVAYLGVCNFGSGMNEVNGMVDPEFRHQGLFTKLYIRMKEDYSQPVLLLSDRLSEYGQYFVKKYGEFDHSEYEMYHQGQRKYVSDISLILANNSHANEIKRQNEIYFGSRKEASLILPEEEVKKGVHIYLAYKEDLLIGKVHLVIENGLGSIYGLGVLPAYRGKGYGKAILLKSINLLEGCDQIMLQVEVENENALSLYKKVGFVSKITMDYYRN